MLQSKNSIINSSQIHYFDNENNGVPVLLFLHGWGCSADIFKNLFPAFEKDFRVIALDFPGFGSSELKSVFSVEDYKKLVIQFLEKIKVDIKTVNCITHSFGGRVAIKLATEQPLQSIILINSGGIYRPFFRVKLLGIMAKIGKFFGLSFFKPLFYKLFVHETDAQDALKNGIFQETFKKVVTEDLQKYASNIHIPVLLLWGENDTSTPLWQGKQWEKLLPQVKLFTHPGDHFFFLQDAKWTISHILNFLQDKKSIKKL